MTTRLPSLTPKALAALAGLYFTVRSKKRGGLREVAQMKALAQDTAFRARVVRELRAGAVAEAEMAATFDEVAVWLDLVELMAAEDNVQRGVQMLKRA